jgi:hypothetical protein
MTELTNEQHEQQLDAGIKKIKNDLKKQKNNIEKLDKRITTLLDKNKLKKKSKA